MDTTIWQSAIEKCQRKALIYARSRLGAYRQDAEDIVQDALLWTWERRGDYDPQGGLSLESWVLNKVIQRAKDWKRNRHIDTLAENGAMQVRLPREITHDERVEWGEEFMGAMQDLPGRYHGIAKRIYIGGEGAREACRAEGIPLESWKCQIKRLRKVWRERTLLESKLL